MPEIVVLETVEVLSVQGPTRHDAFIGAKRTVCGASVARKATLKHKQRIRFCRRCAAFKRRGAT